MTGERLINVFDQFTARLEHAPRKLAFQEGMDFEEWKAAFKKKIVELLGPSPEPVPLNLEVLDEEVVEDFIDEGIPAFKRQKIVYDTEQYASCVAYLLIPADLKEGEKIPGILNAHGHGAGKLKLATDMDPSSWVKGSDIPGHEASALHLIKNLRCAVIVPDWRSFGERVLKKDFARPNRDPCNVTYMAFRYFGYTLLALNVWDAMRSIDVLETLPFVDTSRIAMLGKSYGGTMTTYTTALDDRIKCAMICGYLSTLDDALSMRGLGNFCGSQFIPGLLEWGDIPDVVGLIAPRPLLIEAGTKDFCFIYHDTTTAYAKLEKIYAASGHPDALDRDVAEVGHEYIFNKLVPFLQKNL